MKTSNDHISGNVFYQLLIFFLLLLIAQSFMGCSTSAEPEFDNTIELYGYIANTGADQNPVIFTTSETSYFVYDYDYDFRTARVKRTIIVYSDNDRLIFIAEKF